MIALRYALPVSCASGVPRRSRSGPMHAHTLPHTRPAFFSSALMWLGVMWDGSSIGISTVSKPHFLNCGKRVVDLSVNGDVKRKVLMPSLMGAELSAGRTKYQILRPVATGRTDRGSGRHVPRAKTEPGVLPAPGSGHSYPMSASVRSLGSFHRRSLHRHALGQIPRLVHVAPAGDRRVVREK